MKAEKIVQGSGIEIAFVNQARSCTVRKVPVAEVELTSRDLAIKIRKCFVDKLKKLKFWQDSWGQQCFTGNQS